MSTSGKHETNLLFIGMPVGHVQLYGEWDRGGGGEKVEERQTTGSGISGPESSGGAVFYRAAPRPPSAFQVLPEAQSGSEASEAGELGWEESGADSQALAGTRQRQAASEGSLIPTGREDLAPSGAGGAKREGERTNPHKQAVGEGRGVII